MNEIFGLARDAGDVPISSAPTRQAAPRAITVLPAAGVGPQASVHASCHIASGNDPELWLIQEALERALNDALRNDLGVTYGVHPIFEYAAHGTTLTIATKVPHAASGVAVASILDTLEALAEGRIGDTALDRYKLTLARGTALRWQRPDDVLALMRWASALGREPGELGIARQLAGANAQSLRRRMAPCVGRESVTVVGREADVVDALGASGLPHGVWQP